jgi:dTDP-4-amino-4,6-dideoxygalactose transaminase
MTTAEGGAAVTANEEWANRMRVMALHGISRDAWKRYAADGNWFYEVVAPGFKYNMTDVAAALGIGQLSRAGEMREKRQQIATAYDAELGGMEAVEAISPRHDCVHAHHLYVTKLRTDALTIDRGRFIEEMKALGVGTSVHFIPLHMHPYYRDTFKYRQSDLPVALSLYERSVSLPIYSRMSQGDVSRVIDAVKQIARRFRR